MSHVGRVSRLKRRIVDLCPVPRSRLKRERERHESQVRALVARRIRDLEEATKAVNAILDRCSSIEFKRESGPQYAIILRFDPSMVMAGACSSRELRIVAELMGRRVEAEIATARFVQSARDLERQIQRRW